MSFILWGIFMIGVGIWCGGMLKEDRKERTAKDKAADPVPKTAEMLLWGFVPGGIYFICRGLLLIRPEHNLPTIDLLALLFAAFGLFVGWLGAKKNRNEAESGSLTQLCGVLIFCVGLALSLTTYK